MKYRFTLEAQGSELRPDSRSSTPAFIRRHFWTTRASLEAEADIIADALRSLADKISEEAKRSELRG